jgi:hypothetical protein
MSLNPWCNLTGLRYMSWYLNEFYGSREALVG